MTSEQALYELRDYFEQLDELNIRLIRKNNDYDPEVLLQYRIQADAYHHAAEMVRAYIDQIDITKK